MLPDPINLEFAQAHACVLFTREKDANGVERPKLYIQCIDAYSRQLELTIQYRHEPGDMQKLSWELHAYRHPGVREICPLTAKMAESLINRILDLSINRTALLFNHGDQHPGQARSTGFVHFHTALLDGYEPATKLLP